MASTAASQRRRDDVRRLNTLRVTLTGAIVAPIFFALCWAGAFLPIGPASHLYLQLFTRAEMSSGLALAQGVCWSAAFGAIIGLLVSLVYNALAPVGR
jgi:hypothetical protein